MGRLWNRTMLGSAILYGVLLSLAGPAFAQDQPGDRLPNLVALPASEISVFKYPAPSEKVELRFASTSWNTGAGPFELRAGASQTAGTFDAKQIIYDVNGGFREVVVGTFDLNDGHQHIHFDGYANYILRRPSTNQQRNSQKTSFCIMDTSKVDGRLPGAPKKPVYTVCGFEMQGMSIGWGDRYGPALPGQAIDLTNLPDGLYELTLIFNPQNRIVESNIADNAACVLLDISVSALTVQSRGACGTPSGGVTITGISPSSGFAGTIIDMTISGSNFFPGIAVGFENGSGPAPVAGNVTVLDASTIKATVTIKSASRGNWDLRVGPALLSPGLSVQR